MKIIALCAIDEAPDDTISAAAALAALHNAPFDLIRVAADGFSAEQAALACARTLQQFETPFLILAPQGAFGHELSAYLSAFASLHPLGRCDRIELDGDKLRATRAAFGGRASITIEVPDANCVAQMRPVQGAPTTLPAKTVEVAPDQTAPGLPIERTPLGERQANLEGAQIIVSGGRGLDPEGFALLEEIAAALGGVVGASLPAVDAGLAPVSRQIGQSGKFVTPRIYVAVGLSGTPQHLAGIGEAVRIFAINKDSEAPIFQFAETSIVADWRQALPLLRDRLATAD